MKRIQNMLCAVPLVILLLGLIVPAYAASDKDLDAARADTARYIYNLVQSPQVATIGGEWAVLGLARSDFEVPATYYQRYYTTVEQYVKACNGVLHTKKYTEYSRVILALTAIGKDPSNVAGYNLLIPLGDYDKTIWQGVNGPIWALLALDSGNYEMSINKEATTQATRQLYIDRILSCQLPDGGWSLLGGTASASKTETSDADMSGMALQALANYQKQPAVKKATEEALLCISKLQDANGGFGSGGTGSSESVVQMLLALTELGLPLDDPRFVKSGNTLLDSLMIYYQKGAGFLHTNADSVSNQMATEQAFCGLVAASRVANGKSSLYRMQDARKLTDSATGSVPGTGLPGKHPDVKAVAITAPGTSFPDIASSPNMSAIEALAAREIICGKPDGTFDPDANMTRAEFATIVVKALGLTPRASNQFEDVQPNQWYAGYVGTAYHYGIVTGFSATSFQPSGTITRQEAATMVARAAARCGMVTTLGDGSVRDILAQFGDYVSTGTWARPSLAFCYQAGILDQRALNIQPKLPILRSEIAQMLFQILESANLL